jgi:membrane protein YqaA with SNARE-associated domain
MFGKWAFMDKKKPAEDFKPPIALITFIIIGAILLAFYLGIIKVEDFFCFIKESGFVGLIALFFICTLANAALFLPTPLYALVVVIGAVDFLGIGIFTPLIVGVIAATGGSIGEFSGYLVGYLGITTFNKMSQKEVYSLKVLKEKLDEMGIWLLIIFSFAPLPFDIVGIVAGLAKYSKTKFFLGCWLGKTPKYVLIAYAGYFGVPFLLSFFGISIDAMVVSCANAAAAIV